ncbi:MAG: peptidase C11 [Eubacterium sp.]|nr:peptidase C11 [Eubacterium sp.]
MEQKRPLSRKRFDSGESARVSKRGEGLGTGPVGQRKSSNSSQGGGRSITRAGAAAGGGGISIIAIIFILLQMFGGSLGGDSTLSSLGNLTSLSGNYGGSNASMSAVNTSVASGSREKRTVIKGNGQDKHTIMVYMCGTDLESKSGMASNDLAEMASATLSEAVNVIVYTGGCNQWKSGISNKTNQIYQIKNGKMKCLVENDGNKSMVESATLTSFIKYCNDKFPANRKSLIFWDHGGGSVTGFGYDEKNGKGSSMTLSKINAALKSAGTTFDFIGFDACLMATAETALMMNNYADYMIASEETEPGIGWYYTNWLTKLSKDSSMETTSIGKNIIDDYTDQCQKKCPGQKTTLSIVDLAEFSNTVPGALKDFSNAVSETIAAQKYSEISDARNATREFAQRSKIDQIDLADMADHVGNAEGKALSKAVKGAVKYNRTSSNMTNSYGVSIYFPYKKTSYVDKACQNYDAIGMGSEYSKCIKQFAAVETTGQISSGGSTSPLGSLLGNAPSDSSFDVGSIIGMLSGFAGGARDISIRGLNTGNIKFLTDSGLSDHELAEIVSENHLKDSDFQFKNQDDKKILHLSEDQWKLVHSADQNMFVWDGSGYMDLGLDNVFDFTEEGDMIALTEKTWLGINGQPVAYYHTDTTEEGDHYTITGYVPAFLNGVRVKLILVFDNEHEKGYVAGAEPVYAQNEIDAVAKNISEIKDGDQIEFICDYYTENGTYQDSYYLGKPLIVDGELKIANVKLENEKVVVSYKFTDIYNNEYWAKVQ